MSLYPIAQPIWRSAGTLVSVFAGAQVEVYDSVTNTPRTVYEDLNGLKVIDQPLVANPQGVVFFYSEPGRIRLEITVDGAVTWSEDIDVSDVDIIALPVIGEIPTGLVNGSNNSFTVLETPVAARTSVYVDRLRQTYSVTAPGAGQFSVSSKTITVGTPPTTSILIDYWTV